MFKDIMNISFPSTILQVYLICLPIIVSGYYLLEKILETVSKSFRNTEVRYVRRYIIKNLIKSFVLAYISYHIIKNCHLCNIYLDVWDHPNMYSFTALYGLTDVLGLVMVPGLPRSTVMHHMSVALFSIINLMVDYQKPTMFRYVIAYGMFSNLAFVVNFYLGFRKMYHDSVLTTVSCVVGYYTYVAISIVNMFTQLYLVGNHLVTNTISITNWDVMLYLVTIPLIINDDIVLMRHLRRESAFKYPD